MKIKRMNAHFDVKTLGEEGGYYLFEGYASTFGNVDRGGDMVVAGAFADACRELMAASRDAKLPVLWQHESDEPIGAFTELREDEKGLFVKGRLPKSDTLVSGRVWPQMQAGSVADMSIGYSVDKWETDGDVRVLKAVKLWEISLVTIPMNPLANITSMKTLKSDDLADMTPREIEAALKEGLPMSNKLAKTIASMLKAESLRDGAEGTRDAGTSPEEWSKFISEINNLTKKLEA